MTFPGPNTSTTIWIWPSGLFPRRLIYYFRAKNITLSTLKEHNIQLIPVALALNPPALEAMEGHEARPSDASLPILRTFQADGSELWIRESLSILEYFEELFPSSNGWADLRGDTPQRRAQTRDFLSLLNDAMHWSLVYLINSDSKTTFWSGLKEEDMSKRSAEHAKGKWQFYLDRLEQWLQDDAGRLIERTTIADFVLLAHVEYHEMMYDADWIQGRTALKKWVESIKAEAWYVESKYLTGIEEGRDWRTVLGD